MSGFIGGMMTGCTFFAYAVSMWYGGKLVYDDQGNVMKEYNNNNYYYIY